MAMLNNQRVYIYIYSRYTRNSGKIEFATPFDLTIDDFFWNGDKHMPKSIAEIWNLGDIAIRT